jgi:site-specific recombinase XerD
LLLESLGSPTPDLALVTADVICRFVREQSAKLKTLSCRMPVSSLRVFLRFLASRNLIREGLDRAVPTVRQWKLASLPKHLSDDEVARMLNACDRRTSGGLRDRALLMLLARLGLRAAEALHLTLDDIDWKEGRILIRAGKAHRERILPLSHEVGSALVAYLKKGRPKSPLTTIFLRCRPPYGPLKRSSSVTAVAKSHMERAGVSTVGRAAHALRHTAATGMVSRGASFKEVADVLGHQCLVTTAIYAKLDVGRLAEVALPWPGGDQ